MHRISVLLILFISILYVFDVSTFGIPKVIDGDTIEINHQRIRLYGIDTPELKQTCKTGENREWQCGYQAKKYIEKLINMNHIYCWKINKDKYKRSVSICYNSDLKSINAEMVKMGYAVAATKYSKLYINEEREAKDNKIGIWSGEFVLPEEFRRKKRLKK